MRTLEALPTVLVDVDGAPFDRDDLRFLGSLEVRQALSLPTLCELCFFAPPEDFKGGKRLRPGVSLRLRTDGGTEDLFRGEITAVLHQYDPSGGLTLRVRGYDPLHRLRKRQPVRAHLQVAPADLARELAGGIGLSVRSSESGPVRERIIQHRETDFDLLLRSTRDAGLFFHVEEDRLLLFSLEGTGDEVALELGSSLLEAQIEVNGDPACRSVDAHGWDPRRAESRRGHASSPRSGRSTAGGAPPGQVGGTGERVRSGDPFQTDLQAEAAAQADLDREVAREATFSGVAQGDARLKPGRPVRIRGVAPELEGRYILASVVHRLDGRQGFQSALSSHPPAPPDSPAETAVAVGVVTQVDDPENLGRVKATLPEQGDLETEWMAVVVPAAGPEKGLVALPDVGDKVLVFFVGGDPAQGIVLGGLYGTQEPPDAGVEGGRIRRYTLRTPGGQQIRLDDEKETLRLETATGSFVEFTPEKVALHAAVDLELEAPGRAIVIRGKTVDFEQL